MPHYATRKRKKPGMRLHNAIAYSRKNGISNTVLDSQCAFLGSGSYGEIYAMHAKPIVFKYHKLREGEDKCRDWEHEYAMQKGAYAACNSELQDYDLSIARPYAFRYVQREEDALHCTKNIEQASGCMFTMDKIPNTGGTKWNSVLKQPLSVRGTIPPYVYMGSVQEGPSKVTLNQLRDSRLVNMPNDAMSYCILGPEGESRVASLVHGFFVLLAHGFMPRDIEYVVDGRTYTQSHTVLIDFNEVRTIEERRRAYGGSGYDVVVDAAHVYIDLCGLRAGQKPNPMAPYDAPTPQWKFLCNPMVSPATFLNLFASNETYRSVGSIVLEYAFEKHMKQKMDDALKHWTPLYVYRGGTTDSDCTFLGSFTEDEYAAYRASQCAFHTPVAALGRSERQDYFGSMLLLHDRDRAPYDPYVEYDIRFQIYILSALMNVLDRRGLPPTEIAGRSYHEILDDALRALDTKMEYNADDGFPSLFT